MSALESLATIAAAAKTLCDMGLLDEARENEVRTAIADLGLSERMSFAPTEEES